jgi:hypothetical protein
LVPHTDSTFARGNTRIIGLPLRILNRSLLDVFADGSIRGTGFGVLLSGETVGSA